MYTSLLDTYLPCLFIAIGVFNAYRLVGSVLFLVGSCYNACCVADVYDAAITRRGYALLGTGPSPFCPPGTL
ncbi:hypothetical protein ACHHYP_20256 [Achlya hypogyna]|uniref:Uncharacterized protein n=1 Tax=Achlya hypogyna TaxID=1202772 RepID=A0A1V9YUW7_ACHHY|nr:hypothetical protein ACHHYP_20256 [Achlya hypogyna]